MAAIPFPNGQLSQDADRVIFGPENLGEGVRLAFVVKDDAIIELYEEK